MSRTVMWGETKVSGEVAVWLVQSELNYRHGTDMADEGRRIEENALPGELFVLESKSIHEIVAIHTAVMRLFLMTPYGSSVTLSRRLSHLKQSM